MAATNITKHNFVGTAMSRLIRCLIKIRFVPVKTDKENSKAVFKLFGLETIFYIVIFWGILCLAFALPILVFKDVFELQMEMLNTANIVESVLFF